MATINFVGERNELGEFGFHEAPLSYMLNIVEYARILLPPRMQNRMQIFPTEYLRFGSNGQFAIKLFRLSGKRNT